MVLVMALRNLKHSGVLSAVLVSSDIMQIISCALRTVGCIADLAVVWDADFLSKPKTKPTVFISIEGDF